MACVTGGRYPVLWIIHEGTIHTFRGEAIPRVVAITATTYQKNGKWSNTTYQLKTGSGVPVYLLAPLHGKTWPEGTFEAAYERFSKMIPEGTEAPSLDEFRTALARDYAKTHERMAEAAAAPELT